MAAFASLCSVVCREAYSRAQQVRFYLVHEVTEEAQHEAGSGTSLKSNFMRRSERGITIVGHSIKPLHLLNIQHLRRGVGSAARIQRRLGCTSLRTDHLTRWHPLMLLATYNVVLCDKFTCSRSLSDTAVNSTMLASPEYRGIDWPSQSQSLMAVVSKVVTLADQLLVISWCSEWDRKI